MKFGIREICDVVLKAKSAHRIGSKVFYKNEPVIYFDTLKTSTLEGAATTVYAQGGRGNSRLVAWEGERTLTFTMEDALISPAGFMILSGAGLIEAGDKGTEDKRIKVHSTETVKATYNSSVLTLELAKAPYYKADGEDYIYVMIMNNDGDIVSEPYIGTLDGTEGESKTVKVKTFTRNGRTYTPDFKADSTGLSANLVDEQEVVVFVDYYTAYNSKVQQIEITADSFGGNYYLEASTLFRTENGDDLPAEIIIPNCKIQSNFTFTMASSGDPSTFTFTMDAFPDTTRFDSTKKVLVAIQIIDDGAADDDKVRTATGANDLTVD